MSALKDRARRSNLSINAYSKRLVQDYIRGVGEFNKIKKAVDNTEVLLRNLEVDVVVKFF